MTADITHRRHAVIEDVHADLKASELAHLPSGVFTANATWLVCAVMAFNLTRPAATLTKTTSLAKAAIRHDPPQAVHRPGPPRHLSPTPAPAPARALALGNSLVTALQRRVPPAGPHHT